MNRGLSLRELGRRTGVTASLLSQIENGKSDPSVSTLSALVAELGLSMDALLRPEGSQALEAEFDHLAGLEHLTSAADGNRERSSPVSRPLDRPSLDLDSGVVWERLTRGPSHVLDALLVTYQPGATSSSSGKLLRHSGIEHAYLISGRLTLQLGFDRYELGAGDSLEFDGATPHVYCNPGDVPARGLWFVLGRDSLPLPDAAHRRLHLAEAGARGGLRTPVEFLQAFTSE